MKPFVIILWAMITALHADAAICEKRATPLLHSVVDTKGAATYIQPDERPFLPDRNVVTAKPCHGQKVTGYALGGLGLGTFLFATYLFIANPTGKNNRSDDVMTGDSSRPLALALMTMSLALLVTGILMLTETHRGAPKRKKAW